MAKRMELRQIGANELVVDHQYQRPLNENHVEKLQRSFNRDFMGAFIVSERSDGTFYVLDGQHRLEAFRRLHGADTKATLPCMVYTDLSMGDEADIFTSQQASQRIHPVDYFKARCFSGDPSALSVASALAEYGLTMRIDKSPTSVSCPHLITDIYEKSGRDWLRRVLRLTTGIYTDDRHAVPASIIGGVHTFLLRYGESVDEDRFVDILRSIPKSKIDSTAASMAQFIHERSYLLYGRAFLHFYNGKMRGTKRLPDWDRMVGPTTKDEIPDVKRTQRDQGGVVAMRPVREATA